MNTRRDFIKWLVVLPAVAQITESSATKDLPTDILQGISTVNKKVADLSGDAAKFRAREDGFFEETMRQMWREANGNARYIRTFQDQGEVEAHTWRDRDGAVHDEPVAYVSFFQYRRA